jgi:hypothetical protein
MNVVRRHGSHGEAGERLAGTEGTRHLCFPPASTAAMLSICAAATPLLPVRSRCDGAPWIQVVDS